MTYLCDKNGFQGNFFDDKKEFEEENFDRQDGVHIGYQKRVCPVLICQSVFELLAKRRYQKE
jgi:hypothetical protein